MWGVTSWSFDFTFKKLFEWCPVRKALYNPLRKRVGSDDSALDGSGCDVRCYCIRLYLACPSVILVPLLFLGLVCGWNRVGAANNDSEEDTYVCWVSQKQDSVFTWCTLKQSCTFKCVYIEMHIYVFSMYSHGCLWCIFQFYIIGREIVARCMFYLCAECSAQQCIPGCY